MIDILTFRQNPDNHFLFCPLASACRSPESLRESSTHHLCSPGFTWCVDCDRDCGCMKETDGYS